MLIRSWRALLLLPRELWILALSLLINRMGSMAMPFLVLYLTKKLAFAPEQAGVVLAAYGLAGLIITPIGGWLCDRYGALHVMLSSLVLSSVALLAFPFVTSFGGIILLTIFWSITTESFRPASLTLTTLYSTPENRKSAFALSRLAINLGFSVGPALGGVLAYFSFTYLFVIDGLTTFAAAVIVWYYFYAHVCKECPSDKAASPESIVLALRGALGDSSFRFFLLASIPVNMVFFQCSSTLPLFLVNDLGFSEATYGFLWLINTLMITFLEIPLNAATARWSHRFALALGSALFALGFGALAFTTTVLQAALTYVIWTIGEMILFPQSSAYVSDVSPPDRRGGYMGLYTTGFNLAFVAGPWAGTLVYQALGARVLWIVVLFWGLLSTIFYCRVKLNPAPRF